MATRSTIALSIPEGIQAIYCHWDGYLEGVGQTLKDCYMDLAKIEALFEKGDISTLKDSIEESVFYTALEENLEKHTFKSQAEWLEWAALCNCEFAYLFDGQKWIMGEI